MNQHLLLVGLFSILSLLVYILLSDDSIHWQLQEDDGGIIYENEPYVNFWKKRMDADIVMIMKDGKTCLNAIN